MEYLNMTVWNNSVREWLTALVITFAVLIFLRLLKWALTRWFAARAQPEGPDLADLAATMSRRTLLPIIIIFSVYAGLQVLDLPQRLLPWIFSIAMAALIIQVTLWATSMVDFFLNRSQRSGLEDNTGRVTTLRAAGFVVKLILAAIALLLILDNIPGVEITALVASLGIGGIAVALAVQNILSDLFASLSIVLDKPFVIGDFIIVDSYLGSVEHIGLKTTRVRSLSGEQLIFSNNDLLKSRVRNYKRMAERRVVFAVGVTYQTPYDKLKQIPATIREIIEGLDRVRFDRAHFQGYGDYALKFEVVYYVLNPDYNIYMDIQQDINLAIYEAFEKDGIEFAYPTQTVYIEGNQKQAKEAPHRLVAEEEV
jgi:small-conductance mechanosensitive channel